MNTFFDGKTIKYEHGYSIEIEYFDDDCSHCFNVFKDGICIKDSMTVLEQAHDFVVRSIKDDLA